MDTESGLRCDVEFVRAGPHAIGPDGGILVDANNGYTLNIVKTFLE